MIKKHSLYKVGVSLYPVPHALTYKSTDLFTIEWGINNLRGAKKFLTIQYIQEIKTKLTKYKKPYKIISLLDQDQAVITYYDFDNMNVFPFKGYIFTVNLTKNEYSNKEFTLSNPQEIYQWKKKE